MKVILTAITYRLIQNPRHTIHKELEVLGPVQPSKVVTIVVLWRSTTAIFRDRIQEENEEKLQAIDHQDLLGIFPHNMVIGDAPCCRVIFHGLIVDQ